MILAHVMPAMQRLQMKTKPMTPNQTDEERMSRVREALAKFGTRCAMERPVGRRWVMEIDEAEEAINKIMDDAVRGAEAHGMCTALNIASMTIPHSDAYQDFSDKINTEVAQLQTKDSKEE